MILKKILNTKKERAEIVHNDPKIESDAYSKEEEKHLDYLIKKHSERIGVKNKN